MRKLYYYVACTLDHFIAEEDGSFDRALLMEGEHLDDLVSTFPETIPAHLREHFRVSEENRHFDTVLMGRSTYEPALKIGVTSPYPHLKQYLFSQSLRESPSEQVELISENVLKTIRKIKNEDGLGIWLCGGGKLAHSLFSEIDELILKIHPILLGNGIPLFAGPVEYSRLRLTESKVYTNGVVRLHYQTES